MEYNYYLYQKRECGITINKMPIWFKEIKYEGNNKQGSITLHSNEDYDEYYGPTSKIELEWENRDKLNLLYYKEVQKSIDIYNAIGIVVTAKEKDWLMSHEFTAWFGHRNRMMKKRFYSERFIHGIFYCDMTERLINIHTSIIGDLYENFKPFVLYSYKTIICH